MYPIIELNVGPDKVHLIGAEVTVFAARAMPDWTVREFSRVPIYFRDKKYFLKKKTPGPPPYAYRYELMPWFGEPGHESTMSIHYDEAYVAHREETHRADRKEELVVFPGLICIYPFLGFAWSGFKTRVLGPLGFEPRAITAASALVVFCLFMLEGVFVLYFRGGFLAAFCGRTLFDTLVWVDRVLLVLLPLDAAIRYGQVIRGDESPDGFFEWIFRRKRSHY